MKNGLSIANFSVESIFSAKEWGEIGQAELSPSDLVLPIQPRAC